MTELTECHDKLVDVTKPLSVEDVPNLVKSIALHVKALDRSSLWLESGLLSSIQEYPIFFKYFFVKSETTFLDAGKLRSFFTSHFGASNFLLASLVLTERHCSDSKTSPS